MLIKICIEAHWVIHSFSDIFFFQWLSLNIPLILNSFIFRFKINFERRYTAAPLYFYFNCRTLTAGVNVPQSQWPHWIFNIVMMTCISGEYAITKEHERLTLLFSNRALSNRRTSAAHRHNNAGFQSFTAIALSLPRLFHFVLSFLLLLLLLCPLPACKSFSCCICSDAILKSRLYCSRHSQVCSYLCVILKYWCFEYWSIKRR